VMSNYLTPADGFRRREAMMGGAVLTALEALPKAIAAAAEGSGVAFQKQYEASLASWVKLLADAAVGLQDPKKPEKGASAEGLSDINGWASKGVLHLGMKLGSNAWGGRPMPDPLAPVEVEGATMHGLNEETTHKLAEMEGTIGDHHLPVSLSASGFTVGMNEVGIVATTIVKGDPMGFGRDTGPAYEWLYTHGHGAPPPDTATAKAGAEAGANKLMKEEIARMSIKRLDIRRGE
jgi:hypothetical protein